MHLKELIEIIHIDSTDTLEKVFTTDLNVNTSLPRHKKFLKFIDGYVVSIVVEKKYIDKDYRSMYSNYYSKVFKHYDRFVKRVHFFSRKIPGKEIFNLDNYQDSYIGFCTVFNLNISCIGKTVFDHKKLGKTYYVLGHDFEVEVFGKVLSVHGFPFSQQDTNVMVCAHTSLWMVLRYYSSKYSEYKEVYPFQINSQTKDLRFGRHLPSKGITVHQICEIIASNNFHPEYYSKKTYEVVQFEKIIYRYVESGIPVIATTKNHAVVIIGHTCKKNGISEAEAKIICENELKKMKEKRPYANIKCGYLSSYYLQESM
ncbi:MAG: C39 family peptidase, partial [Nitrospinae bacterium]|nr:C39 family peptidase [Nitrospinota bacterium]